MEFQLLGDVRARHGGTWVTLGRRHERCLLGLLLVEVGRPVTTERLADLIWDGRPPGGARGTIQTYVARLRRSLDGTGVHIAGVAGGYRVDAPAEAVDLHRFHAGVAAARCVPDPEERAGLLRTALALWRGPLLGDAATDRLRERVGAQVEEARLAAMEACAEADLAAGHPDRVVALLGGVAPVPPVRERLVALLMAGYDAAGRRAEALRVYRQVRRTLVDDLGIEPGAELCAQHLRVLRGAGVPSPGEAAVVPRELPPSPGAFTGRRGERERVVKLLRASAPASGRARLVVLHGRGGVGKSALALRVAHDVAESFPDGQVYVDMNGSTPGIRPRTAHEAVSQTLRSLGVRPADIPADEAEAAGRLRSLTGGRRLLFVLDNAPDPAAVRPLIPAASGCAVLVTSRAPFASLAADLHLALPGLSDADAHRLLERTAGRPAGDPEAARQIVEACERLPLALRIAGARLRSRPDLPVAVFAGRLRDHRRRLDELDIDGLAVRGSIQVSYDALAAATEPVARLAHRAFVRLPLLALPDVTPEWVAALLDMADATPVRAALDHLVALHLLHPVAAGRYGQHDLVRLFAAEYAERELTPPERDAAVERGLALYVAAGHRVCQQLAPTRLPPYPQYAPRPDLPLPALDSPGAAVAWMDAELANILVAAEAAVAAPAGHPLFPFLMAGVLTWPLGRHGEWSAARELATHGVTGARQAAEGWQLVEALKLAGYTELDVSRPDLALPLLEEALAISRATGRLWQVLAGLNNLSRAVLATGDIERALSLLSEAGSLAAAHRNTRYDHVTHLNLANVYATRGTWDRALDEIGSSVAASRRDTDTAGLAIVLAARGCVLFHLGRHAEALVDFAEGLSASRTVGNGVDEWLSTVGLARTRLATGDVRAALRHAVAAARLRAADRPYEKGVTLRLLAAVTERAGRAGVAAECRRRAGEVSAAFPGHLEQAAEAMLAHQD